MKQLKCEMCGSTDLVKQDGLFVCQVCGTKYSVEEARKMMVEGTVDVSGSTVKVDNSDLLENYLRMAENAFDASNNGEAETYCNKVIELDPQNYRAWLIKGEAVGWQSKLANSRIGETVNAFSNAVLFCPDDQKEEVGECCKKTLLDLHLAMLSLRLDGFKRHPNSNDYDKFENDINEIFDNTIKFLEKSQLSKYTDILVQLVRLIYRKLHEAWQEVYKAYSEDDDRHPSDHALTNLLDEGATILKAFRLAMKEFFDEDADSPADQFGINLSERYGDPDANNLMISIYNEMISIQELLKNSCSYKVDYSSGIKRYVQSKGPTDEAKRARDFFIKMYKDKIKTIQRINDQIKAGRIAHYWEEHKEEKENLDKELSQLQETKKQYADQIAALQKEKEDVPAFVQLNQIKSKIEKLQADKKALGLFKAKEKQAIQAQIDSAEKEKAAAAKQAVVQQQEIDGKIEPIRAELNKVIAKIKAIENELTKDR